MTNTETTWRVRFTDERGESQLQASGVELEDGIYVFWRGDDVFLRVPADQIGSVEKLQ